MGTTSSRPIRRHARRLGAAVAMGLTGITTAGCDGPTDPEIDPAPDLPYAVAVNRREAVGTTPAITILRSDGTVEQTLSCPACRGQLFDPRWSKDGRMLSVTSKRDTFSVLLVFNRDGTGLREVARVAAIRPPPGKIATSTYPDFYADWSSDGRLLYTRSTPTHTNLETVNADGSSARVIHTDSVRLIARWGFANATISAAIGSRIFAMNPDGSNLRSLTPMGIRVGGHSWSPDGRSIAFTTSGDVNNALMSVDVASGALRTVYTSKAYQPVRSYCWSPNSARFSLVIGEFPASYLTVNADGSELREQAQTPAAFYPKAVWTPGSRHLLFLANMGIQGGSRGTQLYRVRLHDRDIAPVSAMPDLEDYSLALAEGESCS